MFNFLMFLVNIMNFALSCAVYHITGHRGMLFSAGVSLGCAIALFVLTMLEK